MIEWIKYDKYSRNIESHVEHLVTDGNRVLIAIHAKMLDADGYGWFISGGYSFKQVTHWAKINLPGKRKCTACNGTGTYDWFGSPPCGACDGTGEG